MADDLDPLLDELLGQRKPRGGGLEAAVAGLWPEATMSQVPSQPRENLGEAQLEYLRDAEDAALARRMDPSAAAVAAGEDLARIDPRPAPDEPYLTVSENAWRSLLPKVTRADGTAGSEGDQWEALLGMPRSWASLVPAAESGDVEYSNPAAEGLEWLGVKDDDDDKFGLKAENQGMWLLRVLGTAAQAAVAETLESVPVPYAKRGAIAAAAGPAGAAVRALAEGGANPIEVLAAAVRDTSENMGNLGDVLFVTSPEQRGRRHYAAPATEDEGMADQARRAIRNWSHGVLDRISDARGYSDEFERDWSERAVAMTEFLGAPVDPDMARDIGARVGWWNGLALDVLLNWESVAGALPKGIATVSNRARTFRELLPKGWEQSVNTAARALRDNELEFGEWLGRTMGAEAEQGRLTYDDLPPDIQAALNDIAMSRYGLAGNEFWSREGAPLAPRPRRQQPQPSDIDARYDPEARVYRLVTETGDEPVSGVTFNEALDWMTRRQVPGDEVWHGRVAPVTRWGRKQTFGPQQPGRPVRVWHELEVPAEAAARGEAAVVADRLLSDPRAMPPVALRVQSRTGRRRAQALSAQLANAITGTPTQTPPMVGPASLLQDMITEASRVAVRRKLGTSRLTILENGAMVPKQEAAAIRQRGATLMRELPPKKALEVVRGTRDLTEAEERFVEEAARAWGVNLRTRDPGKLSAGQYTALRHGALTQAGGAIADARVRINGTPEFMDRLQDALSDAFTRQRKLGPILTAFRDSMIGRTVAYVLEGTPSSRAARQFKSRLKKGSVRIERAPDDVADDLRALFREHREAIAKTSGRVQAWLAPVRAVPVMLKLWGRYTPPLRSEVSLAAEFVRQPPRGRADLDAFVQRVKGTPAGKGLKLPDPADPDYAAVALARTQKWVAKQMRATEKHARMWLESAGTVAQRKGLVDSELEALRAVEANDLHRVYDEVFLRGEIDGPVTAMLLDKIGVTGKHDGKDAMLGLLVRVRQEEALRDMLYDLERSGLAFQGELGDLRYDVLVDTMLGRNRAGEEAAYPEAVQVWANEYLRSWGIDPGAGVGLSRVEGMNIPAPVADQVNKALSRRGLTSRSIFSDRDNRSAFADVVDQLLRQWKSWTTHGIILPNIPHYTGQAIAVWPLLVTTRGWTGAAEAGVSMMRHPKMVSSLMRRIAGEGHPRWPGSGIPEGEVFVTASGDMYTLADLARAARHHGLGDSAAHIETADQLADILAREEPGEHWFVDGLKRIRRPVSWWNDLLREGAGAFDQAARVAVYLDGVHKGLPLDEAAAAAKRSQLDFRNIRPSEAATFRRFFAFYVFMRKNADAHVYALARHPARVLGQMRLAHASMTSSGLSEAELGSLRPGAESRLTVYEDEDIVDDEGRVHPLMRMNRLSSTPVGVGEFLGYLTMLTTPLDMVRWAAGGRPSGDMGESLRDVVSQANPIIQTAAALGWGIEPGRDRDIDHLQANRIPEFLLESPVAPIVLQTFGVDAVPMPEDADPAMQDRTATIAAGYDPDGPGRKFMWAAGARPGMTNTERVATRRLWQAVRAWWGRPLHELERQARAAGVSAPGAGRTQAQEIVAYLSGLDWKRVYNEDEVVRRATNERVWRIRQERRDVQETTPPL